ncbi:MAG: S8 family peptidase [Solibacillus sp.]
MSANNNKGYLPILGNGELLISPVKKKFGGGEKPFPRTYEESKKNIINQVKTIKTRIQSMPENKRMDEIVLTVRLNEGFLAKSYCPDTFFRHTTLENIGSRRWMYNSDTLGKKEYSKLHFIKTNENGLTKLVDILESDLHLTIESFEKDVRKIEEVSMLETDEVIQGFANEWSEGTVEFVLHPFEEQNEEMLKKFIMLLTECGVNEDGIKVKSYSGGPNFVTAVVNKNIINHVSDYNPLRTVHPLKLEFFPQMRGDEGEIPKAVPPLGKSISRIKVGVFDGGIDQNNPFLKKFSKENQSNKFPVASNGIQHGTAVAGVALYGDLNQYTNNTQLEDPVVFVESFRVLPLSDPKDFDLYEAIDYIEKTVPIRHDINVYNLSFGPVGPIVDDEISRFTYSLDMLAWNHKKLFVVAVGNDGNSPSPFNRIQAPADIVNGLGVGAYTFNYQNGSKVRADYSCIGDGREGCKVKPDISAFGGDSRYPMHLLNASNSQTTWLNAGTSFAAPIVSSKAAEILGRCEQFNPIVARALLIHTAENPNKVDTEIGYGIINMDVDNILECNENKVTIIYSNSMNPSGLAKLPIPLPMNSKISSKVEFSWTIATTSKANALHVEDYTESAVSDTFYPHDKKYTLSKKNYKPLKFHILNDKDSIKMAIDDGYKLGSLPNTSTAKQYQTEQARRGELKWDTVVKKWKNMNASSLENPFLVLHGLGRNGSNERIDYAVVLTISIPKYKGNLYEEILNEYKVLQPIGIRSRNEIMIQV